MEKNKTAELYKDLIKANIASINKMLNEINGNTIDSYTCCKFAVEVSKINEGYYSRLAVLKPAESNFLKDDMYSSKKLQLRALEIANNIPVCIHRNKTIQDPSNTHDHNMRIGRTGNILKNKQTQQH